MSDATELETPVPPARPRGRAATDAAKLAGRPPKSGAEERPSNSWATLWLADRDIAVFTALAAVAFVLSVVRWGQLSGWGVREIEIERLTPLELNFRLDLNRATWIELAQLDGVGEALAQRIVDDREANGPFRSVDDLDRVKGIGAKTLERLRPFLRIEEQGAGGQDAGDLEEVPAQ